MDAPVKEKITLYQGETFRYRVNYLDVKPSEEIEIVQGIITEVMGV